MVFGVDDVLIAAAIAAVAGYVSNEISSSKAEKRAKNDVNRQHDLALENEKTNWYLDQAEHAGADTYAARERQKYNNIEKGYQGQLEHINQARQDAQEMGIGNAAVGFLSSAVANSKGWGDGGQADLQAQAADFDARGQQMDLQGADFGLAGADTPKPQQPFVPRSADPMGGFQLQESDFGLDPNTQHTFGQRRPYKLF